MAKESMSYEVVMVFSTVQGDDAVTALADKFRKLITENATVGKVEEWGKRRLAYPINDELDGYYLLVNFTSTPDFPAELDRVFNITDGVLRTLIVCKEHEDAAPAAKAETKATEEIAPADAQPATEPVQTEAATEQNA